MVGEENETFFIRVWKPLPSICVLKLERKSERERPKRTIFDCSGFRLLQMILEPDTRRCANEEPEPRRE